MSEPIPQRPEPRDSEPAAGQRGVTEIQEIRPRAYGTFADSAVVGAGTRAELLIFRRQQRVPGANA